MRGGVQALIDPKQIVMKKPPEGGLNKMKNSINAWAT
jgi:hypothetical protein